MPTRVQVPGHGIIEFPDGMSQDAIKAALMKLPTAAPAPTPPAPQAPEGFIPGVSGNPAAELVIGAAKGAANTAINLGEAVHQIPGVSRAVDWLYGRPGLSQEAFAPQRTLSDVVTNTPARPSVIREAVKPSNPIQQAGFAGEQIAEYFVPAGTAEKVAATIATKLPKAAHIIPRMAAEGAVAAGVAGAQGADPTTAAVTGAVGVPIARTGVAIAEWAGSKAEPLVRAAIKPTVTAMKRIAGRADATTLDAKANQLVRFIIENKITSPEKASAILKDAERELQRVLSVKNAPTDEPTRVLRYLQALERSASRQRLPAEDVAVLRNTAAELVEGSLGTNVVTMVPQPHPTLIGPNGQPVTVLVPQTTRVMRGSTPATEALDAARSSSRWQTNKQWGEQKGTATEAKKAVERAGRDAVKAAVPEVKPLLRTEQQAIQARDVLDRMQHRTGNRDAASLPGTIVAGQEVAAGKVPILGFAVQWLRNNQMKAGMWADDLRKAIARKDVQRTAEIMRKLGVAVPSTQAQR